MELSELLGRTVRLTVDRIMAPGAFLTSDDDGGDAILLPTRELPEGVEPGDTLDAFVYLDSEDRPIATTSPPKLELGEVRFLTVSAVTRIGAFVDWGLSKELLVPFAEQTVEPFVGDRYPIGLLLDRSGRLCGTMRVREMLMIGGRFERDELVVGEAWRQEPGIGVFCILERKYLGLLPASEPHSLSRGEETTFRVRHVFDDGKIELSLRSHSHQEIDNDAQSVLSYLARDGSPALEERSSPERIRRLFGLSKKAFKRAVGRLLRNGEIAIDPDGRLRIVAGRGAAKNLKNLA